MKMVIFIDLANLELCAYDKRIWHVTGALSDKIYSVVFFVYGS